MPKSVLVTSLYDELYEDQDKCYIWDALWNNLSIGRIARAVNPSAQRIERIRDEIEIKLLDVKDKPDNWTPEWDAGIIYQLYNFLAANEIENDLFPALHVPRDTHSQSQGIADIFGAQVALQETGNTYVYPLPPDPEIIDNIVPGPVEKSRYYGAVKWIKYAHEATGGIQCRFPVMTGPMDTANYLLGTTTLLEWVYAQPETLHRLLDKITDIVIEMISAIKKAAGGTVHSHHFVCTRGGFDFCSEVRSLISLGTYEEFEASRLKRIGEALGPYGIHSCGNWERTIPSAIADPNLRMMNGQIKENDLATLCELASGNITLSIGPSINVHDRYMWDSMKSFYQHIKQTIPNTQPFELSINEDDLDKWDA